MLLPKNDIRETLATLLRNKFVVASLIFLTWVGLFDEDNLIAKRGYAAKIAELEEERDKLSDDIARDKRRMEELKSSRETLEKFAREEYFMKEDDEVIFIVRR